MEIITSHIQTDFDALGSMLAAKLLYPDALIVFPGSQEKSVRDYLLAAPPLVREGMVKIRQLDLDAVSRMIVVDTRQASRLGKFSQLLGREDLTVILYDHHGSSPDDIHGNLEALEAVLADIRAVGVDDIYCLGDVVGYGADPRVCLQRVAETCGIRVRGNHEAALLGDAWIDRMNPAASAAIHWTAAQLTAEDLNEISTWPLVRVGADARLVHGSPDRPAQYDYVTGRFSIEDAFRAFPEFMCFCGHTHIPLVAVETAPGRMQVLQARKLMLERDKRYLINVGSVGQPRDGNARARWVLMADTPQITFREVAYDVGRAQEKIRKAGLPEILAYRLSRGS